MQTSPIPANSKIRLPHNYAPRDYQHDFWAAFDSGKYNRFVKIWHRRAGKDTTDFNLAVRECVRKRQLITYVFPTLKMGREILWEGVTNDGNRFIEHYVPGSVVAKKNDTRMTIHFKNDSILRIGGADNPDSLRGGNSAGFIISEWSEHDPYTWTVIRPIVLANGGWVLFNYTPKGDNHAKTTLLTAQENSEKGWWHQVLPANKTGVFTPEQLEQELLELIRENGDNEGRAKYEQEYMCSFDSPVVGSYFGEQIRHAEAEGRIGRFKYESGLPVHTVWDLGVGDSNAIWLYQAVGREIHVIDHLEASGMGVEYYAGELNKKPYVYGRHYGPHDIDVKEWGSGQSRRETAANFGIQFQVVAKQGIADGIQAARNILSRCYFDAENCERGLSALKWYQKDFDKKNKVYRPYPKHDWSSHSADAFRYLAVSYEGATNTSYDEPSNSSTGSVTSMWSS